MCVVHILGGLRGKKQRNLVKIPTMFGGGTQLSLKEARPRLDGKEPGSRVAVSESRVRAMRNIAPCACGNEWV